MSTTQTGNPGPFRMADEIEWDERNGTTTTMVFRGARREIDGLVPTYQVPGYRVTRRQEAGDIWRLEVRASMALDGSDNTSDDLLSVEWSTPGSTEVVSIYKGMALRGVPDHLITYIESWVNDMKANKDLLLADAVAGVRGQAAGVSPTYDEDDAEGWFLLVLGGVENHRISNFTVRKVLTAPNEWVAGATLNVGKLYTRAQLLAEHTGVHACPVGIYTDLPTTGYYYKETPQRSTTGNGKIQVQQDWQHADFFSPLQYDLAP